MQQNKIEIYTDGASRGNPGPGGYGVILIWGKVRKELSQGYRRTTNNRMELLAVIAALEALKKNRFGAGNSFRQQLRGESGYGRMAEQMDPDGF